MSDGRRVNTNRTLLMSALLGLALVSSAVVNSARAAPPPVLPATEPQSPQERAQILSQTVWGWCFPGLTGLSAIGPSIDPANGWIHSSRVESIGIPLSPNAWVEPHGQLLADLSAGGCLVYAVGLEREAAAKSLRKSVLAPAVLGKVIDESFSDQDGHVSTQAIDLADGRRVMIDIVDTPTAGSLGNLTVQMILLPKL